MMAEIREELKSAKPWEILAVFFAYFAVAKDVPYIFRTLCLSRVIPASVKKSLLHLNSNPDFWFLLFFTFIAAMLWLWLPRKKEVKESEKEDIIKRVAASMRRKQIIRIIRSFGLVWIREFLLGLLLKVSFYGTFKRPHPPAWPSAPDRLNYVDRISFLEGHGIEFQYSADYTKLIIRTHPKDSDQFSEAVMRKPSWQDVKLLMLASNIFPFWFLAFLLKCPLRFLRKKRILNG